MTSATQKWFAAAGCVALAVTCGVGLWRDMGAFGNTTSDTRLSADFADTAPPLGISSYAKSIVMKDCFRTISSYGDIDMLSDVNRRTTEKCATFADETVAATPSDSFAWLVRAAAAIRLSDVPTFNRALRQSQLTGPNEQWISTLRVGLAEQYLAHLDDAALAAEQADLRMLASSEKGILEISDRYVKNPEFRDRITAIVEGLPAERQKAFLIGIKKSIKNS